jgi:hypothetical protein
MLKLRNNTLRMHGNIHVVKVRSSSIMSEFASGFSAKEGQEQALGQKTIKKLILREVLHKKMGGYTGFIIFVNFEKN